MKETLIDPADVTRRALLAGGWFDAYWCKDQPVSKLAPLNRVTRQPGKAMALYALVTSHGSIARIRQLRPTFEQMTSRWLAKAECRRATPRVRV